MLRRTAPLLLALATALAVADTAAALSPQATARQLAKHLRPAGGASGALVVDVTTGVRVFASRSRVARIPASVEKLYTTSAAMLRLGAGHRLHTQVSAVKPIEADGTVDGNLYLRGGGDPTLTTAALRSLARRVVEETGLTRVTGRVIGDESAFDRLRGVPSAGYAVSVDVQPLGALMVDRGRTGRRSPYYQPAPAAWAAGAFARALRDAGVRLHRSGRQGTTPAAAVPLTARRSASLARLAGLSNVFSDNYVAEMLLKALGASTGRPGTTAGGAALAERTLADQVGIHPTMVDGSGLSRSNRTSPAQVVRLLREMTALPEGEALYDSLAVAGRTGTLRDRLRSSVARGRCRGKTGTLRDVSNLAGFCRTTSGDTLAFAILMNGVHPPSARRLQDRMVSVIARYDSAG